MTQTQVPRGAWHRVYDSQDGFHVANPGFGNTRFAPFSSLADGVSVPTMYLAETLEAALLETAFHNVDSNDETTDDPGSSVRVVTGADLRGRLRAELLTPRALVLADLRDPQLEILGIPRDSCVSSSAAHYPCTQQVAQLIHALSRAEGGGYDGIVWHSRQAELTRRPPQEVVVVFCDRVGHGRDCGWELARTLSANGSLTEGAGEQELLRVADLLEVTLDLDGW